MYNDPENIFDKTLFNFFFLMLDKLIHCQSSLSQCMRLTFIEVDFLGNIDGARVRR